MALLAPISHGFLEDDDGAPGLYVSEAGVVVIRSAPAGPLVPVGAGGGAVSPLVLTSTDAAQIPLTLQADALQTADLLDVYDENGETPVVIQSDGVTVIDTLHVGTASNAGPDPTIIRILAKGEVNQSSAVLQIDAADSGLTGDLIRVRDENGQSLMDVYPTGTQSWHCLDPDGDALALRIVGGGFGNALNVLVGGDTVFQIQASDGSVHIKTGTTVIADL